jgi:lysozyme family protein
MKSHFGGVRAEPKATGGATSYGSSRRTFAATATTTETGVPPAREGFVMLAG